MWEIRKQVNNKKTDMTTITANIELFQYFLFLATWN